MLSHWYSWDSVVPSWTYCFWLGCPAIEHIRLKASTIKTGFSICQTCLNDSGGETSLFLRICRTKPKPKFHKCCYWTIFWIKKTFLMTNECTFVLILIFKNKFSLYFETILYLSLSFQYILSLEYRLRIVQCNFKNA